MIPSPSLIWFLVGVGFVIAELLVPGFILIFFAAGSWIAALATLLTGVGLTSQILVFIVSSLILLFTLRKYSLKTFKGRVRGNVDADLADSKIGKTAIVTQTITPHGPGEIKFMGSFWRAVADMEIEEGQSVLIVSQESADSLTFKVIPVEEE